jgi:hypothetical protein
MAKRGRADDVDRLSDLPDCLLHDILSRLKARQLVQTCVLSSRWRRLWLTAPCLDIDAGEFASVVSRQDKVSFRPLFSRDGDGEEEENDEELARFDDFVDSLLLRRCGCALPLGTLRLSMPSPWPIWMRVLHDCSGSNSHARWVRRGLRCSPATLDVSGIKLPPLASGTHRLTCLRLYNVRLHKDFEKHLSSWLPVLEDLEIRCTEMRSISRIASNTLKNLTVDNSPTTNQGTSLQFVVDAPRLSRLHLVVQFQRLGIFDVTLCEATSPAEASICFLDRAQLRQVRGGCYYWQDDKSLLLALCKLLGSLSSVSSLELSGFQDMVSTPFLLFCSPLCLIYLQSKIFIVAIKFRKFNSSTIIFWSLLYMCRQWGSSIFRIFNHRALHGQRGCIKARRRCREVMILSPVLCCRPYLMRSTTNYRCSQT